MKILKNVFIILSFLTVSMTAFADTYVNGYYRSNGTYVKPHYRSDANSTVKDNWSTKGNTNPYTGAKGTRTYGGQYNSNYDYNNNYNETKWK